jgi:hypothetical protein
VRRANTPSWSFAESEPQMLHVALFVRDCVGLPTADEADVPPTLAGDLADLRATLTAAERAAARQQWLVWWRQLTAHETGGRNRPPGLDDRTWMRQRVADLQRLADRPAFASLSDRPELQTAVAATFEQACRWHNAAKRSRMTQPHAHFPWALVRDAAKDMAFDLGVELGDVEGMVIVLATKESWSHLLDRGAALCSPAIAADASAAYPLLRAVFTSRLQ